MKNSPHANNGFTLIEVLIAMMLLSVALVMLANSWGAAHARVEKTQISFVLASLLEQKMNSFERKYRGKPLTEIQEEETGDFGEDYPEFTWSMTSQKYHPPDIAGMMTAQDGGANTMALTVVKQIEDLITKSIKEVTVTVIYTKKKQKREVNATTYFVDYDKSLNLGLPGGT